MARIIPKLNLNKTPQVVDNNSLIFAKNVRLLKDNTISRDSGIDKIDFPSDLDGYTLVGYIPYNTKVYLFFYNNTNNLSVIYEYDEQKETDKFTKCHTGWKYSGGTIEGVVTVNLRNDTLITITEYFENFDEETKPLIPIKTINLSISTDNDDESIYSNAPIIPVLNLVTEGTYNATIPNGVYQFFVRYEIVKDYFTSWFPCSEELFTANIYQSDTTQGTVRYIKPNVDSNESFVFAVDKLNNDFDTIYKGFQIGYILSHDDTIKAKSWKKFPMTTTSIKFDYDKAYTEDIDISEIIRPVLNLYNVKNITNFKNKFYISNYIESDYNKDLAEYAKNWIIQEEGQSTEGIGSYLYDKMVANYINIAYNTDNITNYTDIIQSFGEYNTINSILSNRDTLLDNGTALAPDPCEESNFHICTSIQTTTGPDGWFDDTVDDGATDYLIEGCDSGYTYNTSEDLAAVKNYAINTLYKLTNANDSIYVPNRYIIVNEEDYSTYSSAISSAGGIKDCDIYSIYSDTHPTSILISNDLTPKATYIFKNIDDRQTLAREQFGGVIQGFDVNNPSSPIVKYNGYIDDTTEDTIEKTEKALYFREYFTEFKITGVTGYSESPRKYKINITRRYLYKTYRYNLINGKIVRGSNFETTNVKTLIPFQSYNCYIHFVKDTGEITNGYIINNGNSYTQRYDSFAKDHYKLLPKFVYNSGNSDYTNYTNYKNKLKRYGYSYYFFSIAKVENKVVELINPKNIDMDYKKTDGVTNPATALAFDAIDVDTLQVPLVYNIPIYKLTNSDYNKISPSNITTKLNGLYVDSGQVEDQLVTLFGASGKVVVKDTSEGGDIPDSYKWYIILPTQANTDNLELIKCTKYFKIADSIQNNKLEIIDYFANLQDYICTISKKVEDEYSTFISSTDYYDKDKAQINSNNYTITLSEIESKMPYRHNDTIKIYSNFNLNFLELTNDIKRLVRRYTEYEINYYDSETGDPVYVTDENNQKVVSEAGRQLTSCFDSLTLSDLYTFPSMFKNYTRRYYSVYDKESIVVYNNTLRASELEGDEEKTFVYKFLAEVTYNIPTDKGIITNLISVGDAVLVHTQDSIYKFTGKVALSSADTNVQTVESDIFDTGVQEVVGSKYGFAGLKNKHHSLLSQFGYMFWDADVNVIYAYTGEGQMAPISDPINKLLKYFPIETINFCEDYYNDRFFIQITYKQAIIEDNVIIGYNYPKVILSYNIKAKSFVSLHDFSFEKTFNTKTNTYFTQIINDKRKLYKLIEGENNNYAGYGDLLTVDNIYPTFKINTKPTKPCAVIDIIYNNDYEFIKTLDSISWICSEIDSLHIVPNNNGYLFLAEEALDRTYPGTQLMIYTDTCASELLEIIKSSNDYPFYKRLIDNNWTDVKQDDISPKNTSRDETTAISTSYKYPRYNLGKWSFNYFRNILNNKDISMAEANRNFGRSDNNSLIYGKYFVFRFIFDVDVNFKFENLTININNNYGNN